MYADVFLSKFSKLQQIQGVECVIKGQHVLLVSDDNLFKYSLLSKSKKKFLKNGSSARFIFIDNLLNPEDFLNKLGTYDLEIYETLKKENFK